MAKLVTKVVVGGFAALVVVIMLCHLIPFTWGFWGNAEPEAETPTTALADQLKTGYLIEQDLATQQRVFWRYYNVNDSMQNYNDGSDNKWEKTTMHSHELRFLPEFAADEKPAWEQVSRYLCDFAALTKGQYRFGEQGADCWAYDDMVAVADVLLPSAEVEQRSSGWLNYIAEENCYESVGWDTTGAVYYLLTEPIACEGGVYTAKFAGYALGEMWFDEEEIGKSYNDRVAYEIWQHGGEELSYFIDNVLPGELAADNLNRCENLTVTFELSGNDELPLSYLSCERKELLTN